VLGTVKVEVVCVGVVVVVVFGGVFFGLVVVLTTV
jgi:hypothetical protein